MPLPISFQHPLKSLFQSAVREVLRKRGEITQGVCADHPMMQSCNQALGADDDQPAPAGASKLEVCASLYWQKFKAEWYSDQKRITELDNQIRDSQCDPRWAEVPVEWAEYYALHTNPQYTTYNQLSDYVYPLPASSKGGLTVGVLGDWGTGEQVARVVLDELMGSTPRPDLLIHVGDVYYSGTANEDQDNFLNLVNDLDVPVYTLPGNHDYYSGGKGFYETLLPNLKNSAQEASYFCLRNEHWQLQGMDTGYHDHNFLTVGQDITRLRDDEAAWHQHQLDGAEGRKVILFSHHQLCSAFTNIGRLDVEKPTGVPENYNPHLAATFKPYLPGITAWFWGHEHLLEIYAANAAGLGLARGRCVGHSAFPMLTSTDPYLLDPPKRYPPQLIFEKPADKPNDFVGKLGTSGDVYNHGYVMLQLPDNPTPQNPGTASYYQTPGDGSSSSSSLMWSETL